MSTLRDLLGAETGRSGVAWIALQSDRGDLAIEYVHGQATSLLADLHIADGQGLTGKVYEHRETSWVNDYVRASSITHEFDDVIEAESVVRMIAAPLTVGERTLGVLTLASRETGAFAGVARSRIEKLAERVGLSLEIARAARTQAEAAAAAERKRLAGDLHDSVGALLFSVSSRTERLRRVVAKGQDLDTEIEALQDELLLVNTGVRTLLSGWHQSSGDLYGELTNDVEAFERRTDTRAIVVATGMTPDLDQERTDAICRLTREALLNVEKHARASSVSVTVACTDGRVQLAVIDDGDGLGESQPGIGLRSARERLQRLGGDASLVDGDDGGAVLRAWIPTTS